MKNSSPAISVILPFYNAEATLYKAVSSILNQEFDDLELILVDNHSSDGSAQIGADFSRLDRRVIMTSEKCRGVAHASNTGAALARGKYVARMDADDVATPRRLKLQKSYLDDQPDFDAMGGLVEYVPGTDDRTKGFARYVEWSNAIITPEDIARSRFIELPIVNPTLMWRRAIQEKHGLYKHGPFPEDYEMVLRWLAAGVRFGKVPEVVLQWHDSPGRLTRSDPVYSDDSFFRIKTRYLSAWLKENNPFHPEVTVWGASRLSRKRAALLQEYGVRIIGYIDIKKTRQLEEKVIYYENLPPAGERFILSYVRQGDSRERVREYLNSLGYMEQVNYLLVS